MTSSEGPMSVLRQEHRVILDVVRVLETLLARAAETGSWDLEELDDCVAFFQAFADACHHGKEEDLLFPELVARGLPEDTGPIAVMLEEHRLGRALVARMAEALPGLEEGNPASRLAFRRAAEGYAELIRGHISKEDGVLFEMADRMVVGPGRARLCGAYGRRCDHAFDGRTKDELERLAGRLVGKVLTD